MVPVDITAIATTTSTRENPRCMKPEVCNRRSRSRKSGFEGIYRRRQRLDGIPCKREASGGGKNRKAIRKTMALAKRFRPRRGRSSLEQSVESWNHKEHEDHKGCCCPRSRAAFCPLCSRWFGCTVLNSALIFERIGAIPSRAGKADGSDSFRRLRLCQSHGGISAGGTTAARRPYRRIRIFWRRERPEATQQCREHAPNVLET